VPRAGFLALVVALVLSGCGGTSTVTATKEEPTTTTAPADPGKAIVDALWLAARRGSAEALWALLSTSSKERLGPTLKEFRTGPAAELEASLGAFTSLRPFVSERITPEFGVVAVDGRRDGKPAVYAVALRIEGASWKVELGGPVKIRPIGPDPGARETVVAQVAAAVEGPGGTGTALMYVDGQTQTNLQSRGTSSNATLFANFEPALDPGRHTVVVFASDGREASATAWAFTVAKKARRRSGGARSP
jgi:hypothetical protein